MNKTITVPKKCMYKERDETDVHQLTSTSHPEKKGDSHPLCTKPVWVTLPLALSHLPTARYLRKLAEQSRTWVLDSRHVDSRNLTPQASVSPSVKWE